MVHNKELIQRAAETQFSSKGFHATSIRDIASIAGVSLAMINYHFKSKENLLVEILSDFMDRLKDFNPNFGKKGGIYRDKLNKFIEQTINELISKRVLVKLLMQVQLLQSDKKIERQLRIITDAHYHLFLRILTNGIAKGEFKPIDEARFLYHSIFGTVNSLLLYDYVYMEKFKKNNVQKKGAYNANELTRLLQEQLQHILYIN